VKKEISMKIIGLTGSIASGKTTLLKIFSKLGYPTISADEVYHTLLKRNKKLQKKLIDAFGYEIIDKNKNISTKKIAKALTKSEKNLELLEKITHPFILKEIFNKVKYFKKMKYKICVVDIPLLFEKKLQDKFDYIITVYCSKKIQNEHLKKRNVNKKLLKLLLARQMSIKQKIKMSNFVINNNNLKMSQLTKEVLKIIDCIS